MDIEKLVEDGARRLFEIDEPRVFGSPLSWADVDMVRGDYIERARALIRLTLEAAAGEAHRMYVDCHESNARTGAAMLRNIFQELAASIGGNND